MPRTSTQAVPRSLHSTQTLCAGVLGLRAFRNAASTSSNWCLLIGQPCSSKSTLTCALIGVEVASVSMKSGRAYTAWVNSRTSLKIAQRLDAAGGGAGADGDQRTRLPPHRVQTFGIVRRGDGAFDQRHVIGAAHDAARGFGEIGDVDRSGDRQQLVLAVEQRKLAAVAGGELPDGELGLADVRPSYLPQPQQPAHLVVAHHRAVLADEAAGRTGSDRTARRHIACCAPATDGSSPPACRYRAARSRRTASSPPARTPAPLRSRRRRRDAGSAWSPRRHGRASRCRRDPR